MTEVPEEVGTLVRARERARRDHHYEQADALRERLQAMGFDVADTPSGPVITPLSPPRSEERRYTRVEDVPSLLAGPPHFDATVQWVVEGWPADVIRGVESFRRHHGTLRVQHVVVEAAGLTDLEWPEDVDLVRVDPALGWAAARNAGLVRTAGSVVVVADGSVEATGDPLGPLVRALEERTVGISGPFGVVSDDLREFRESEGPDVDAIQAYLMAFRRDLLERGVRFDRRFRFYRGADLDLSFQVKALGFRAVVTAVPVRRHPHRVWEATPEDLRARLSKRNFYRFLDRWRGRPDLLVVNRRGDGRSGG